MQTQAGGQVHADAAASLLRQPLWIDEAVASITTGRDLAAGQSRIWMTGLDGYFGSDSRAGIAGSTEYSAGPVVGATWRFNDRASVNLGIGDNWGMVSSVGVGGTVTFDTVLATIGGCYGFSSLDAGPFVAARANAGWVDYWSNRSFGGGLGTARGDTTGATYSGRADLGDVVRLASYTITPQVGVRIAHVTLDGFNETGGNLALGVNGTNRTLSSVLADLDVSLDPRQLGAWTIAPDASLGYELGSAIPRSRAPPPLTVSRSARFRRMIVITS